MWSRVAIKLGSLWAKFDICLELVGKIHRKARKWSERDARALTDKTYRDSLLKRMMRQGLATLAPHEIEHRKELVKQAVELMTPADQRQLVNDIVNKTSKGELCETNPERSAPRVAFRLHFGFLVENPQNSPNIHTKHLVARKTRGSSVQFQLGCSHAA